MNNELASAIRNIRKRIQDREDANRNYNSAIAGAVEKGAQQQAIETAKNLLSMRLSIEQITQATGLSIKEVETLRAD